MNFTQEELRNLLVFLNRVQLSGQEAETLVMLKIKLGRFLEAQGAPDEEAEPSTNSKKPAKKVAKD